MYKYVFVEMWITYSHLCELLINSAFAEFFVCGFVMDNLWVNVFSMQKRFCGQKKYLKML